MKSFKEILKEAIAGTTVYTKNEAIRESNKRGGKGNIEFKVLDGGVEYWSDVDTGELYNVDQRTKRADLQQ